MVAEHLRVSLDVTAVPARPVGAGQYTLQLARALAPRPDLDLVVVARHRDRARWATVAPAAGLVAAAPERRPTSAHVTTITVRPGDSLWSIAQRLVPGEDPRPVVDELDQARHGALLQPGEKIEWSG